MIRVQHGRQILSAPIRLPGVSAIPAEAVPVSDQPRPFVADKLVLQREQKQGVPTAIKTIAPLAVLLIALSFAAALAWGVARIGGTLREPRRSAPSRPSAATPLTS